MKKSILSAVMLTMISALLIGGGTFAWFSDATEPIVNEFTVGTIKISAFESVSPPDAILENWNPGDSAIKEFTIENIGTKCVKLSATFEGQWFEEDGITPLVHPEYGLDYENVTWTLYPDSQDWEFVDGVWYYEHRVNGTYSNQGPGDIATLSIRVDLSGSQTDNYYQGKIFKLKTIFYAEQCIDEEPTPTPTEEPTPTPTEQPTPTPTIPQGPGTNETAYNDGIDFGTNQLSRYFEYVKGDFTFENPFSTQLLAGNDRQYVGDVKIWDDGENIFVQTTSASNTRIYETHVYMGLDEPEKSAPGQFGFAYYTPSGATLTLIQSDYIFDNQDAKSEVNFAELDQNQTVYISVHATVKVWK